MPHYKALRKDGELKLHICSSLKFQSFCKFDLGNCDLCLHDIGMLVDYEVVPKWPYMSTYVTAFKANHVTFLFNIFFISPALFLFSNGLCVAAT